MPRTFVIAEAGSCHDLEFDKAWRLVGLAAEIGADAVKFQWTSDAMKMARRRNVSQWLVYDHLTFPEYWFEELHEFAISLGLDFMCTVYLPEDVKTISRYVTKFKVSSFELQDLAFQREHAKYGLPMIISAGMTEHRPVHVHGDMEVWWLYCVSAYPTPDDQINLARLRGGEYDGLSDHTLNPLTGALAVAAGAKIIEFHYRLHDTSPECGDYPVARTSEAAAEYVLNIRQAERLMGDGLGRIQPCEVENMKYRVQP